MQNYPCDAEAATETDEERELTEVKVIRLRSLTCVRPPNLSTITNGVNNFIYIQYACTSRALYYRTEITITIYDK